MTLSLWRLSHLALALVSSIFLIIASVTGVILALDAAIGQVEMTPGEDFNYITLAEVLPLLREGFPEITELSIEGDERLLVRGLDAEYNEVVAYVDPRTGEKSGTPKTQSEFIQWVTALHRSLFLHRTGRVLIGISAFLLILIAASGIFLVIQRQQGFRRFFSRIAKDSASQYYHVVLGRWLLIPILIIAITGTYLFLAGFNFFPSQPVQHDISIEASGEQNEPGDPKDFPVFQIMLITDVQQLEFPFSDDPGDYFKLKLKDRELIINQFSGEILSELPYPLTNQLQELSVDLHTGKSNLLWAIILAMASVNILYFIYSGIAIWRKRTSVKIKNKYKGEESSYILLVGSENGSTLRFANAIHQQLLAHKQASYLGELNHFTHYPKAEHLIVFTATHGLGEAPSNARKLASLVNQHPQKQHVNVSVVGFGSQAYPNFCGYAREVDALLSSQRWAKPSLALHTVNDKCPEQFTAWVKAWADYTKFPLNTVPAFYRQNPKGLQSMRVLEKKVTDTNQTFMITIRPGMLAKFNSGDLLAVYPVDNGRERFYSIGKIKGNIQLVVKLHPNGMGSNYLNNLNPGDLIKARIIHNPVFHFPKNAPAVAMVSNGAGIAPFLGMIDQNKRKTDTHLYTGFRKETELTQYYRQKAAGYLEQQQLKSFHIAFSREENPCYVMGLIIKDAGLLGDLLKRGGVMMICGSLAMQRDVEATLDTIIKEKTGKSITDYKANRQLLSDCY